MRKLLIKFKGVNLGCLAVYAGTSIKVELLKVRDWRRRERINSLSVPIPSRFELQGSRSSGSSLLVIPNSLGPSHRAHQQPNSTIKSFTIPNHLRTHLIHHPDLRRSSVSSITQYARLRFLKPHPQCCVTCQRCTIAKGDKHRNNYRRMYIRRGCSCKFYYSRYSL